MDEALDALLRRVAAGEISPEAAEPLVAGAMGASRDPSAAGGGSEGRAVRIQVTEAGRTVVNLRVPMSWTGLASLVPGLSETQAARVSEALRAGQRGRILDIKDAQGDGVIISTE